MSSEKAIRRVGMRVAGQDAEGMAHHAGARDLAERADMRQARGAVAGLEQRLLLAGPFQPFDELARLLERPGIGRLSGIDKGWIVEMVLSETSDRKCWKRGTLGSRSGPVNAA